MRERIGRRGDRMQRVHARIGEVFIAKISLP
jgi:hypothetical protein